MGKQKFQCKICGAILNGGQARREHCQRHHPGTPFGRLDVFFPMEYKELDDETYRSVAHGENRTPVYNETSRSISPASSNKIKQPLECQTSVNDTHTPSSLIPSWIMSALCNGENLFITGKAGTGKTTLLREIVKDLKANQKCVAVLAPTGVAAKNAGGVTIHSFLRLPISPYLPNVKMKDLYSLTIEGITAVKKIDTIIIDEISMVRCDLLDMMDAVLRHYRNSKEIFGGVRIIAFGDLYQLMPVVTSKDWPLLKEWYRSPYFFSSKVYEQHPFTMLTLKKVYRQTDSNFLDLLNEVRNGEISERNLSLLKQKYNESGGKNTKGKTIRITTHNRLANEHNETVFSRLSGAECEYKAVITGYVHRLEFPTTYSLVLKKGARVMFVKNDTSAAHAFVNGSLGTVISCDSKSVTVRLDDNNSVLRVASQIWYFDEYVYNRSSHTLDLRHRGTFRQIPLKLAWAITIHKSQGLTFDSVVIDAGKAFTYGQVYVALSRCRRFEGITLVTPITAGIIKTDPIVKHFMNPNKDNDELPAYVIPKKSSKKPKKPTNIHGLELLKWLAEHDFSIQEMSVETGYNNTGLVYHDLCKLIAKGKIGIACRLPISKINDIKQAYLQVGLDADIRDVKPLCKTNVNFGEIQMVRSHLEYMSKSKNR